MGVRKRKLLLTGEEKKCGWIEWVTKLNFHSNEVQLFALQLHIISSVFEFLQQQLLLRSNCILSIVLLVLFSCQRVENRFSPLAFRHLLPLIRK